MRDSTIRMREWREKNRDRDRANSRAYEQRHKEARLAKARAWKASEAGRAWFEQYRAQHYENVRRHYQKDLAASRMKRVLVQARRRARQVEAGGVATYEQIMARVAFYGGRCYLCRAPWQHIDHVIPLANGGSNWPANLRPICAPCNSRKHTKPLEEVSRTRLSAESA